MPPARGSKAASVSRARATQVVDRLLERRVVRPRRTTQASKYLVPSGEAQVALAAALQAGA